MSEDEIRSLMQDVAQYLAEKPVLVRFREPVSTGAAGAAYRSANYGVIDLDPDLSGFDRLITFLHEVAHLRYDLFLKGDYYQEPSRSLKRDYGEVYRESFNERIANGQAVIWFDWALDQTIFEPGESKEKAVARMLTALKQYRHEESEKYVKT